MAEYIDNTNPDEFTIPVWDNNPQAIHPNQKATPWGYYDVDPVFQCDAVKFSIWAAGRLGYPQMAVELQSGSFYACYEEAINEYSSIVNQFNMRENMLTLQGSEFSVSTNLSQQAVRPNLGRVIQIATEYGTEAGSGGDVAVYSASIQAFPGTQVYDLESCVSQSMYDQGIVDKGIENNIEIRQVFQYAPPAINRYFNPFLGTGNQYLMSSFGWDKISGVNYVMMPLSNDLLRVQAIKMSDQVRKSAYSFQILDNKIRVFPKPLDFMTIWFSFIFKSDRNATMFPTANDGSTFISDMSDAPFGLMQYKVINMPGKQWIAKWGLALCRELLGAIRSKYTSVPSLNEGITLDGESLKAQAATEKEILLTEIKDTLEAMSKKVQLENKAAESEQVKNILNNVPMPIYIG